MFSLLCLVVFCFLKVFEILSGRRQIGLLMDIFKKFPNGLDELRANAGEASMFWKMSEHDFPAKSGPW